MWFECEQPFLSGERCVTSRKTAAKETSCNAGYYIWENRIVVSSELIAGSHEGNFQMQFSFDCEVVRKFASV